VSPDPLGSTLHDLFALLFLGPALVPDLLLAASTTAGLVALLYLPLSVRPWPGVDGRHRSRAWRGMALACGLALPGGWDLAWGRLGAGAFQALSFGACYAVARAGRGEGFLGSILAGGDSTGYFTGIEPGVHYLLPPPVANAAALGVLVLFAANVLLTLWRAGHRSRGGGAS